MILTEEVAKQRVVHVCVREISSMRVRKQELERK